MYQLQFQILEEVTRYFASLIQYDVSSDAPSTFEAIKQHFSDTGRLLVWDGASDNTIFNDAASNHAFRAWHDYAHILVDADFTVAGEQRAMLMQIRMVSECDWLSYRARAICTALLQIEVMGQLEYALQHGDFPENQRQFAISRLIKFPICN